MSQILDSHIHLWPLSASNPQSHSWMTPNHILTKEHLLSNYFPQIPSSVTGVIYVETDRALPSPSTLLSTSTLETYTSEPLLELHFLKSIVEEEYGSRESEILKAIVIWAPLSHGPSILVQYLHLAQKTLGAKAWSKVKGVRFLLQGITSKPEYEDLVLSEGFRDCLRLLGRKGLSFDLGVSCKDGGVWQLATFTKALENCYKGVEEEERIVVILNHMCKPDYTVPHSDLSTNQDFKTWKTCIETLASYPQVHMKLSGGFSELFSGNAANSSTTTTTTSSTSTTTSNSSSSSTSSTPTPKQIATTLLPWTSPVFKAFTPRRILFGSDWPVCNVKGPAGEDSWAVWREVVEETLKLLTKDQGRGDEEGVFDRKDGGFTKEEGGYTEQDAEWVWSRAAEMAYRVHGY